MTWNIGKKAVKLINFFPVLYKDEMLLDAINRYKQKCGMISKQALELDLFDQTIGQKSILFPQNISTLISKLPPNSKITAHELILNHTAYPFFSAFLSEEKSKEIYNCMKNRSEVNIENIVGIVGSKVKLYNRLRYCPICFSEDMERYGESFWRRIPQIPGVLYCPKHHVLLKESNILISDSKNDYLCADEETCNSKVVKDPYSNRIKELNLIYIENVEDLLLGKHESKELSFIIDFYIDRLRESGYASKRGYLYINKLIESFLKFYPNDYLELMQSNIDINQEANWLRIFVRYNNKNRSPLRHLLFLQFLGVKVDELFNEQVVIGRINTKKKHLPSFDKEERRKQWLEIIENNPGSNRSELKTIGRGLHTWIYTYDREWYDEVTPRIKSRKKKTDVIDWEKRDAECLALAKKGYDKLLSVEGKPIRITPESIKRILGVKRWFYNKRLVNTRDFLNEVHEDIKDFRIRKIKWAIEDRIQKCEPITVYKVQLHAGFGGNGNVEIKELIRETPQEIK